MQNTPENIAVIGDGSMGTVCALILADNGYNVSLWGAFPDNIADMAKHRQNRKFLPGFDLPPSLRVSSNAEQNELEYSSEIVLGEPDECLIKSSQKDQFDLIIMGSPRPKGVKGLRSRMKTESLVRTLGIPLLIVPYPADPQ